MATKKKAKKAAKKPAKKKAAKKKAAKKKPAKKKKAAKKPAKKKKAAKKPAKKASKPAVRVVSPMTAPVISAPLVAAAPGVRTALNPAAAWPFPTGTRP